LRLKSPTPESIAQALEHYGFSPDIFGKETSGEPKLEDIARHFFSMARHMFQRDRKHPHTVILGGGREGLRMIRYYPADQLEKYLVSRNIAVVVREESHTFVISIGETWTTMFDPEHPERRAQEAPDRVEGLLLVAASQEGVRLSLSAEITRMAGCAGTIKIGPTTTVASAYYGFLEPVFHVWGTS
jgi:hypothetical protein